MSIETFTRTIQVILAPVVMVTSCAILVGGMLTLYAGINDRLRALARERLDLLRGPDGSLDAAESGAEPYTVERLGEIDRQLPTLLRRHELVRFGILAAYGAIMLFVVSMLVIALATISRMAALATLALAVFLAGTAALLAGVVFIGLEISVSSKAVHYEVERVLELGR